jgi:hypothetical protein
VYDVSITNNYTFGLRVDVVDEPTTPGGGYRPVTPGGGGAEYQNWGSALVEVLGMGHIAFIDLGNRRLDAYTNPQIPWTRLTRRGLVRYRGLEAYFRDEGRDKVDLIADQVGSIRLHFAQGGVIINVPDMTVG